MNLYQAITKLIDVAKEKENDPEIKKAIEKVSAWTLGQKHEKYQSTKSD